jgi:hypothetical protein
MVKMVGKVSASVFLLSAIIGGTNLVQGSLLERTMSLAIAQPLVAMWKVYGFACEAVKEHLPGQHKAAPQQGEKHDQNEGKAPSALKDAELAPDEAQRSRLTHSPKVTILLENVQSIDVTSAGHRAVVMQ